MREIFIDCCILLAILLLSSTVFVVADSHLLSNLKPSDLIVFRPGPVQPLGLQNVDPSSARAIAATNEPLGPYRNWELPNLGHRASRAAELSQDEPAGLSRSLLNFSASTPELLASVGNATANITIINGTMVWP